jgi:hypothetical protein
MILTQFITSTYFYECNIFGGVCFVMNVNIILFANTLFQQITHNIACNLWKEIFILQVLLTCATLIFFIMASSMQQLQFQHSWVYYLHHKQFNYNCTTGNMKEASFWQM